MKWWWNFLKWLRQEKVRRKKAREKKKPFVRTIWRFTYLWVVLRFKNTLKWPSLERNHSYGNLPYNIWFYFFPHANVLFCSIIVFVVSIQVHCLLFNNHFSIVVQNVNANSTLKWSDYNLVSLAIISSPLFIWEEAIDIWFEYMWPKTKIQFS